MCECLALMFGCGCCECSFNLCCQNKPSSSLVYCFPSQCLNLYIVFMATCFGLHLSIALLCDLIHSCPFLFLLFLFSSYCSAIRIMNLRSSKTKLERSFFPHCHPLFTPPYEQICTQIHLTATLNH